VSPSPVPATNTYPRDSAAFVTDAAVMLKWESVVSYSLDFVRPEFHTAEMLRAYAEYSRSNLNYRLCMVLIGPASVSFIVTRGSLATLWHLNPAFVVVFASYVVVLFSCIVVWVNRFAVISYRYNIKFLQPYHASAEKFYRSPFRDVFDNAVVVFNALCTGLYMLARVLQGPCPPGTTAWNEQDCNPEGNDGEIPQDALLIAVISVIAVQVFVGCASRHSVAAAWAILLVLMNVSMSLVDSHLFFWNNVVIVIAICVCYETER
jgi:hypothetical protein